MKASKIHEAIGNIDLDLISAAVVYKKESKKKRWIAWGSIAASLALVILSVTLAFSLFPSHREEPSAPQGNQENPAEGDRTFDPQSIFNRYQASIQGAESDVEWPWEYKTVFEKFPTVTLSENEYTARGTTIPQDKLGALLGSAKAESVDIYTNQAHTENFEVYAIDNVSSERMIAIKADEEFFVYSNRRATPPDTFGALCSLYSLEKVLPFTTFSVYEGSRETESYRLSADADLWQLLSKCKDAKAYADADGWSRSGRDYLSFTATSEELGVYKRVFYVTADGFVATNVFDHPYVYQIGEKAARKIISYAKEHAAKTQPEPYEYTLAGTLTGIEDGYILVDDSILCKEGEKGIVFKIFTDDPRIERCYETGYVKVGDLVAVNIRGEIHPDDYRVTGAYHISKGFLSDNSILIPE